MPTTRPSPILLDGGMSRELTRLGAPLRQPEWSALALLETPEIVERAHRAFVEAGAEVITTNSFALVPFHIGEARFRESGAALARLSGELARRAADTASGRPVRVAGCLPPPFGAYDPAGFETGRAQAILSVLVEALAPSVDLWLGETLSLIAEAEAVAETVRAAPRPLWIAFSLDDGEAALAAPEARLRSGETIEQAADWALSASVEALLFNCSRPEVMERAVRQAVAAFEAAGRRLPIGVYANAFVPKRTPGRANAGLDPLREELTPERYAAYARQWHAGGASILGGCCGIGSAHIAELARAFARV